MSGGDAVHLPRGVLHRLLADAAREAGFQAHGGSAYVWILCAACHPEQPENLPRADGHVVYWMHALTYTEGRSMAERCAGFVRFDTVAGTGSSGHDLLLVDDLAAWFAPHVCCHEVDQALADWDWIHALRQAVRGAVTANAGQWERAWSEQEERRAERDRLVQLGQRTRQAAAALNHRERVTALWTVLRETERSVVLKDALVLWECGHTTGAGRFAEVCWLVNEAGLPGPAPGGCDQFHAGGPEVSLDALLAEYERVAAMPEQDRAKYAAKSSKRRVGARAAGTADVQRVQGDTPAIAAWLDGNDLPEEQRPRVPLQAGQGEAWELAKRFEPHPFQVAVRKAQSERKRLAAERTPE